eukprot:gene19692-25612_t
MNCARYPSLASQIRSTTVFRTGAVAVLVSCAVIIGGGGSPSPVPELLLQIICLFAALVWISAMPWRLIISPDRTFIFCAITFLSVPVLQLLPLPPVIWHNLPARAVQFDALALVGQAENWRPLTISTALTTSSILSLLPPYAVLFMTACLRIRERTVVIGVIALLGIVSGICGFIQQASGQQNWLRFYSEAHYQFATGFFANRNHDGDLLLIALVSLSGYVCSCKDYILNRSVQIMVGVTAIFLILSVILTGSRTATALLLLAIAASGLIFVRLFNTARRKVVLVLVLGVSVFVASAFCLLVVQNAVIERTIARFATNEADGRSQIWPDAFHAAKLYWPYGSGVGTFVPAFEADESLELVDQTRPNRAHNDFLEFLIEAGAVGAFLIPALGCAMLWRGRTILIREQGRAGSIHAIIALSSLAIIGVSSIVDYPIRTISLAVRGVDKILIERHSRTEALPRLGGALWAFTFLLFMAGGCSTDRPSGKLSTTGFGPTVSPSAPRDESYKIGPLDTLSITVFKEPDLSFKELPVDASGSILLPLIGDVRAAGKSANQLSKEIAARLNERYLRNAQVSVIIATSESQHVTVEGSVTEPGVYAISGSSSLLQAIARAKSPTKTAKLDQIVVFRTINGQRFGAVFNLRDIRSGRADDPEIIGGDVVVVGFSSVKGVFRDLLATPLSLRTDIVESGQRLIIGSDNLDLRFSIDFRQIYALARRNVWLIVTALVVALSVGAAVTLLTTPKYIASASIQIDQQADRVLASQQDQPSGSFQDADRFLQTQTDVLRSRAMAIRVAQRLNIMAKPTFFSDMQVKAPASIGRKFDKGARDATVALIQDNLIVDLPRQSRVVTISFRSPSPDLAARVANAYARGFIDYNLQRKYDSSAYARDFLSTQLAAAKNRLEQSDRELNQYARQAGLIKTVEAGTSGDSANRGGGQSVVTASLVQLNAAANTAKAARVAAEQKWRSTATTPLLSIPEVLNNPAVQGLLQQRAARQGELSNDLAAHRDDYPSVVSLRGQIADINRQISSVGESIKKSIHDAYLIADSQERALSQQVSGLKGDSLAEQDRSVRFNILQRETDTNRTLYDGLLQRYKEVSAEAGVATNNISTLDLAEAPSSPSSPKLLLNLGLALFAGIVLAAVLVLVREQMDDVVRAPGDVERKLGLTVLGVIPKVGQDSDMLDLLAQPRTNISEAYNALRTSLLYSTVSGLPKSVLVTSSQPAEGKSTTSLAISLGLARLGAKVMLIDTDLRRPSLHRMLGTENGVGLSTVLTRQCSVDSAITELGELGISFISSGPVPPSPTELLGSSAMKELIAELTGIFDIVVFDGPPVLGLADAPIVAAQVEASLFVIEAGRGQRGATKSALRRLNSAHGHISGAILTKFDPKRAGDSSYYGYDYYYYGGEAPKLPKKLTAAWAFGCCFVLPLCFASCFDRLGESGPNLQLFAVLDLFGAAGARQSAVVALSRHDLRTAERYAKLGVARSPFSSKAISLLGQVALVEGNDPLARRAFVLSGRLGWRDPQSQIFLMEESFDASDFKTASERADAAMRIGFTTQIVYDTVEELEQSPLGRNRVAERLAVGPPWAGFYLSQIAEMAPGAINNRLDVIHRAKALGLKIERRFVATASQELVNKDKIFAAYRLWTDLEGRGDALVSGLWDSGFERSADNYPGPFGWTLMDGDAVDRRVDIAPIPTFGHALYAYSTDQIESVIAQTTIVQDPGPYMLTWRYSPALDHPQPQIDVNLFCGGRLIDNTGTRISGHLISKSLIIPDFRCPAQTIKIIWKSSDRANVIVDFSGIKGKPCAAELKMKLGEKDNE